MSTQPFKTIIEPFRIKSVEPIRQTTAEERSRLLEKAGYNLFRIDAADVMIVGAAGSRICLTAWTYRGDLNLSHRSDDPQAASRPFDADRDGMVNGEGAAAGARVGQADRLHRAVPQRLAAALGAPLVHIDRMMMVVDAAQLPSPTRTVIRYCPSRFSVPTSSWPLMRHQAGMSLRAPGSVQTASTRVPGSSSATRS